MDSDQATIGQLPSITDTEPSDESGRWSRRGYRYQDLCALRYLVHIVTTLSWDEVWCESHDDIVLFQRTVTGDRFRFVQVKHKERAEKHWSCADLCNAESSGDGQATGSKSILEKLFRQDRFGGTCDFRLATNEGAAPKLRPFHYRWGKPEPTISLNQPGAADLRQRLFAWATASGNDPDAFIVRFAIEQHTNDADDLETVIRQEIELFLRKNRLSLFGDELDVVLDLLYMHVHRAATASPTAGAHPERITSSDFTDLTIATASKQRVVTDDISRENDVEQLRNALEYVGLDDTLIADAVDLRRRVVALQRIHIGSEFGDLIDNAFADVKAICIRQSLAAQQGDCEYGRPLLVAILDTLTNHRERVAFNQKISLSVLHGMCYLLIGMGRLRLSQ